MNFKLTIQYDGTDFHGWQMQGDLRTVQGELTRALSLIEGQAVTVNGSGRTDAGVHADVEDRTRTVTDIDITERKDGRARANIVGITVSADGFLRYMVRAIAGTLLAVGREEIDNQTVRQGIEEGKRSLLMTTAPACGLTLLSVRYE